MKILVGNKGNVDFDAPVPMTKSQQDSFIKLMKSIFHPDTIKIVDTDEFRVDRIGDHLFQREWSVSELAKLLDVHTNTNETSEMLGRTWMGVVIKRGEVIPDLMKWANLKGYDLVKGDIEKIIEEYLQERKDLTKKQKKIKSAETREKNALIDEYCRCESFLGTIDFRSQAGFRLPTDSETAKKTKEKMEIIKQTLIEKFDVDIA